ncbi:MAG: hypothetical protein NT018_01145 [Armatimonadetes bacterium]|nr:hypothetical protein [Armatimonadota bacterium]
MTENYITIIGILIILAIGALFVRLYFRMKTLRAQDKQNRFAMFLVLREYAYCDTSLEKMLKIMGNLDSPMKPAIEAALAGDFAKAQSILDAAEGEINVLSYLVQARIRQAAGDIEGAIKAALNILQPDEECRSKMAAWCILRELGHIPSEQEANKLLGVVCEFTLGKMIALLAGYADGDARLATSKGFAVVGVMQQHPSLCDAAMGLVNSAKPFVESLPIADSHPLPEPGRFRMSLLTPAGLRAIEVAEAEVVRPEHEYNQVWKSMQSLLTNFRIVGESMGKTIDDQSPTS